MSDPWTWTTLAGLGAFHGLNPAMGWLFAVGLGLQRKSRSAVLASLLPIAIGHALSIAAVVIALALLSALIDLMTLQLAAGRCSAGHLFADLMKDRPARIERKLTRIRAQPWITSFAQCPGR